MGGVLARGEHLGDPRQASIGVAQRSAASQGVGNDRIALRRGGQTHERAGALAPVGQEPGLAQRRGVTRHVRLAFPEHLGHLPDAQLFLGRQGQEAQAQRLGDDAVELPAGGRGERDVGHDTYIYMHAHERKECDDLLDGADCSSFLA